MVVDLSCARAGSCCRQQSPSGGASRWRSVWLASWSNPSTSRRRRPHTDLVHHAHGLLQHAYVALSRVASATARIGMCHMSKYLSTRP
eukprot:6182660-Pleurochrysis_carterae.AAC.2